MSVPGSIRETAAFTLLLLALCSWWASPPAVVHCIPSYWPTVEWQYTTPELQGVDSNHLQEMLDLVEVMEWAVDSVMVIRHGYVVLEEYLSTYTENSLHTLQSVTKSIASILVGMAINQGYITDVSERVVDFFPDLTIANMDERKEQLTLEHLLTMTTGFEWDEWTYGYDDPANNNLAAMHASPDAVQYVLDRPMAFEPGRVWVYCSGASVLLGEIVERATGQDLNAFARANLFDPLGIGMVMWYRAPGGYYHTGGGLYMRSRDMARIGYLMLNNGTWEDSQTVLSSEYAATSTANLVRLPNTFDYGYGFQWWYLIDYDIYYANGHYDQKIFVDPSRDLVAVFTCSIADGDYYPANYLFLNYILPAIDEYTPTSNPPTSPLPLVFAVAAVVTVIAVTGFFWLRRRGAPTSNGSSK